MGPWLRHFVALAALAIGLGMILAPHAAQEVEAMRRPTAVRSLLLAVSAALPAGHEGPSSDCGLLTNSRRIRAHTCQQPD